MPRARGDGIDTCKFCGSDELWGNFFDAEGFGSDGHGPSDAWDLLCQRCAKFQVRRNTTRNGGGRASLSR